MDEPLTLADLQPLLHAIVERADDRWVLRMDPQVYRQIRFLHRWGQRERFHRRQERRRRQRH